MKLKEIEFRGYRRLSDSRCNVEGRTVAFIGPNEAGKSSVLTGLEWLTAGKVPLPPVDYNRRKPPAADEIVVRAKYRLEPDDFTFLAGVDMDPDLPVSPKTVTEFRYSRVADGTDRTGMTTTLQRNPDPFRALKKTRDLAAAAMAKAEGALDDFARQKATAVLDQLDDLSETEPDAARIEAAIQQLEDLLDDDAIAKPATPPGRKLLDRLRNLSVAGDHARVAANKPSPVDAMRGALKGRVPRFVLFGDSDRILAPSYDLGDEAVRANPPAPLANLLKVAETSVGELWVAFESGVVANLRTLERRVNARLLERLGPMWTQSELSIELSANPGGLLEVNIVELDSPEYTVTPIAERSDGLRAFLALVCFLVAADLAIPPVLMVDEAERNLHYDAQADLVRVLTKDLRVHKVIYTTHSPGALPLDLGTGIRVVSRDIEDSSASTLENNFWTDSEPGFSRLLFAMGAEVAAFSAFRRAVLAEGVSEMILLPTLIRNATGGEELDFQVAFGLSNMSAPSALGTVALITTFLVDGDQSGVEKTRTLLDAGFPRSHVFALPKNKAIEDLVDRKFYLNEVDKFLMERDGTVMNRSALDPTLTVAKAVDVYCLGEPTIGRDVSHKIIAFRLSEYGDQLPLSALGKRVLPTLKEDLQAALSVPYQLISAAAGR
ncbi:hypothetical protein BH10ACT7_BH10ACT7_11920 [soil metagenome]